MRVKQTGVCATQQLRVAEWDSPCDAVGGSGTKLWCNGCRWLSVREGGRTTARRQAGTGCAGEVWGPSCCLIVVLCMYWWLSCVEGRQVRQRLKCRASPHQGYLHSGRGIARYPARQRQWAMQSLLCSDLATTHPSTPSLAFPLTPFQTILCNLIWLPQKRICAFF